MLSSTMNPEKEIKIGSLVKLKKDGYAHDEWFLRDYDSLVGLVIELWSSSSEEVKVFWQGKGKFFEGKPQSHTWEYSEWLEMVS